MINVIFNFVERIKNENENYMYLGINLYSY